MLQYPAGLGLGWLVPTSSILHFEIEMASCPVLSSGLGALLASSSSCLVRRVRSGLCGQRRSENHVCAHGYGYGYGGKKGNPKPRAAGAAAPWSWHGKSGPHPSSSCLLSQSTAGTGAALMQQEGDIGVQEEGLVEVGYIADTHGVHGEMQVRSLTDFPQERLETPGIRWLRMRSMGRPSFQRVELLQGRRVGSGKRPSWLITVRDVNTPEEASGLVGSTILVAVTEEERPVLEEDEFYIPDLVGMTVALQESGEEIGVILNVFSTGGANDLLQVRLAMEPEIGGRKIWVPFVEEIVPVVDRERRRVEIAPPQGLLELNSPVKRSEKQGMKERRRLRGKLAGLKKRLTAMGQTHVLAGLSSGSKTERESLLEQLLSIDFSLLQQALKESVPFSKETASSCPPEPPSAYPKVDWQHFISWMDSSSAEEGHRTETNMARWWRKGLQLVADGKVAVVVLAGGQSTRLGQSAPPVKGMVDLGLPCGRSLFQMQAERLLLIQELASLVIDPEFNPFIPWLVLTSDATDAPTRQFFEEKGFFGLDESQVWFIKQDSMPCISLQSSEGHHHILMETPWKLAVSPNGNGGLFSALHAEGAIGRLIEEGIDYLQVYAVDNALVRVADPVFFGYTMERAADVGVKVVSKASPEEAVGVICLDTENGDESTDQVSITSRYGVVEYSEMPDEFRYTYVESWDSAGSQPECQSGDATSVSSGERQLKFKAAHICVNIFSVDFLRRLVDSDFDFKFHSALKQIPHFVQQEKQWVKVVPDQPNGMKLELFIFDAFKFCESDKVALLEVHREEEFAPVKNASRSGVPDSVDTARNSVIALQRKLMSSTVSKPEDPQKPSIRKLLIAYLGGSVNEEILQMLNYPKDAQIS